MWNQYIILLTALCFAPPQTNSDALPRNASLETYLAWINEHNPALQQAGRHSATAQAMADASGQLPDPSLTLAVLAQEIETRVGPQRQKIAVSQVFPWRGKLGLEKQIAQGGVGVQEQSQAALRQKLYLEFKLLYAEYFLIGKRQVLTREHVALLETLESVVDTKYRAGSTPYANYLRLEVETDKFRDLLVSLEDLAQSTQASLNALLAREADAPISFPSMLHGADEEWLAEAETGLMAALPENNPNMLYLAQQQRQNESALALSRKNHLPDLKLGLEWINTGSAAMAGVSESGKDALVLSLGLNIPINRRKYDALSQAAATRLEAVDYAVKDLTNRLGAELKRAIFEYRDASRKISLFRDSLIPKAMESVAVTLKSFEADKAGYLDVIDTEKTLLQFKLSLQEAMNARAVALAKLEHVSGVMIPIEARPGGQH